MFSFASVGVPWACDVGGVGHREITCFPAQGNPCWFLSFVCPLEDVRACGVVFVFSVVFVDVPRAYDFGGVGYGEQKRITAQGKPSRFLSFVCPNREVVRASGVDFAFSVACVVVPWASNVGGAGYRKPRRLPARGTPSRVLSFVCPILENVRVSGVGFVLSVASVGVPWACDVGGV